jgi:hypothetical protein
MSFAQESAVQDFESWLLLGILPVSPFHKKLRALLRLPRSFRPYPIMESVENRIVHQLLLWLPQFSPFSFCGCFIAKNFGLPFLENELFSLIFHCLFKSLTGFQMFI